MRRWIGGRSHPHKVPKPTPPKAWVWRASITMGGFTLLLGSVGGTVGTARGQVYVRQTLLPQISQDLSQSFSRPVRLGEVESLSWRHIRLGASAIPATATDADSVAIEAVEIRFSPLSALQSQTVALDVTLVNPQMVLDQNAAGGWLETELQMEDDERIHVRHLRIRGGAIALLPHAATLNGEGVLHHKAVVDLPTRFDFENLRADVTLGDDLEAIALRATATSREGGQFSLRGTLDLPADAAPTLDLRLQTQQLSTLPLNLALPPAVRFTDGSLTSRLHIHGALDADPTVEGRITLDEAAAWVEGEPNPFTATSGEFRIRNQEILLSEGFTRYGNIPFQVQGRIHLEEGLDLSAQVESVSVPDFMKTFNFTLPFAAEGALTTDNLRVTGPLDGAVFSGTVTNAVPIQLDRLTIAAAQTDFSFNTESDRLLLKDTTAQPQVGGQVIVQADIQLDKGDNDAVALTLEAEGLPGDAIAQLYDLNLPANTLGTFQATGEVKVANQQPQIQFQWESQGGQYPTEGAIALQDDRVKLEEAIAWVGNQPVQVAGTLEQGRWNLTARADAIPTTALPVAFPIAGQLDGSLTVAGNLDTPTLEAMTATGNATLALDAGQITAQANLAEGTWQTQIQSEKLALSALTTPFSATESPWDGDLAGEVKLTGTLQNLSPEAIQAEGRLELANLHQDAAPLFDRPINATFHWADNRLQLHHLGTDGLSLAGWLTADLRNLERPQLGDMDLQVSLQDYDLTTFPLLLPDALRVAGHTHFQGSLTGTPNAPVLQGNLQLRDFALNDLALNPVLNGSVDLAAARGGQVQLAGGEDAIALTLAPSWQPATLQIQLDQGMLTAQQQQPQQWQATLQNLSLERILPIASSMLPAELESLSGELSAVLDVNMAEPDAPRLAAEFAIAQPRFQSPPLPTTRHANDALTGSLTYANQQLALTDTALRFGNSRAQIRAQIRAQLQTTDHPDISAELDIQQGELQDLATLVQSLNLLPNALPLLTDAASVTAFHSHQTNSEPTTALPFELPELGGTFSSTLRLSANGDRPPTLQLDLDGQNWSVGSLGMQSVSLRNAQLQHQAFTLEDLRLAGLTVAAAAGDRHHFDTHLRASRAATGQWTGALQANDLPLAQLADLLGLPLSASGDLDAIAQLSGNQSTPHFSGTLGIDNACLSSMPLDDTDLDIHYQQGRLTLDGLALHLPESRQPSAGNSNPLITLFQANPPASPPATNPVPIRRSSEAKSLIVAYGPLRPSFALADLETFAETGEMPAAWALYLDLAGLEPDGVQQGLTQSVSVDLGWGDRLLNSALGNTLLNAAGQILHTPSRETSATALRAALIQSLQDDNQLSALEFLQNYPLSELHVDAARGLALMGSEGCDRPPDN